MDELVDLDEEKLTALDVLIRKNITLLNPITRRSN